VRPRSNSPLCRVLWRWLAIAALIVHGPARADDLDPKADLWTGATVTDDMWIIYTGSTWAPSGRLHGDGFLLRIASGFGRYEYSGERAGQTQSFVGLVGFADAMAGYQVKWGHLTAKGFVGLAAIEHRITPLDPLASPGLELGPKLQTELWYDAGADYWLSLNAAYTTAHQSGALRIRGGFRLTEDISLGPELEVVDSAVRTVDLQSAYARGGAFATYTWGATEISAAAGLAGDIDGSTSPYVTLGLYTKF
jgi:hypothetical protein